MSAKGPYCVCLDDAEDRRCTALATQEDGLCDGCRETCEGAIHRVCNQENPDAPGWHCDLSIHHEEPHEAFLDGELRSRWPTDARGLVAISDRRGLSLSVATV